MKRSKVETIRIFSAADNAAVGGQRMRSLLQAFDWPADLTDIVLDMSALSMGVGFPAAACSSSGARRTPRSICI